MSPSPTLLSLPVDVLLTVRDVISSAPFTSLDPGLGLLAHISLSQTCRGLRDLYTFSTRESEDSFWKRACAVAGYGRPMRREYGQTLPGVSSASSTTPHDVPFPEVLGWKQIAHIVAAHKRVCEIRSCRNASCWPGALRFPSRHPRRTALPFPSPVVYLPPKVTRLLLLMRNAALIQMTLTSVLRRHRLRFTHYFIISTSQRVRSSTPPPFSTRSSPRTRTAGGSSTPRSPGTPAPRAHS